MALVLAHRNKASPRPSNGKMDSESDVNQSASAGSSNKRVAQGARKVKFTLADLPFQPCSPEATRTRRILWRLQFVPSLLDWAGSCKDPFGTNIQMNGEVASIWKHVFPQVALNGEGMEIVLHLVRAPSPTILYTARGLPGAMGRSNTHPPV
jgi:hypothetical protein